MNTNNQNPNSSNSSDALVDALGGEEKLQEAMGTTSPLEAIKQEQDWATYDKELGLREGLSERVFNLLTQGIRPEEVAMNIGLDMPQMSLIMQHDKFIKEVKRVIIHKYHLHDAMDNIMDDIEYKALFNLSSQVGNMTAGEALATFKIMNQANRRTTPITHKPASDISIEVEDEELVELEVVPAMRPKTVFSKKNQLLEVNGRQLDTIGLQQLEEELGHSIEDNDTFNLESNVGDKDE